MEFTKNYYETSLFENSRVFFQKNIINEINMHIFNYVLKVAYAYTI